MTSKETWRLYITAQTTNENSFFAAEAHPALAGTQPAFALSTHKRWPQARKRRVRARDAKKILELFAHFCGQTLLDFFSQPSVFVATLVPAFPG
jgi:hypothetical protein